MLRLKGSNPAKSTKELYAHPKLAITLPWIDYLAITTVIYVTLLPVHRVRRTVTTGVLGHKIGTAINIAIMEALNPNDYNPHDNHVGQILGIQTVVFILAMSCVVMRLYVRIRIIKSTGVDDWTMGGAALCSIATWALYIYKGVHGIGRHNAWVLPEDQVKVNQAAFWQVILSSCLGMALLKISIGLNLLRLSPSRWYSWCLWAGIVFVAAYCFMGSMTFFLFCKPMAGFWNPTIPGVKCYSIHLFITFALMNTAFNIFSDVLFASLPVPIIWKLQMKRKVRLYLIGVLSLGYVAVAFGVTNGVFQIAYGNSVDSFYNDSIMFFAILQVNTGILAACVPSLKPLASKVLKLSEYTNSNTHRYGTNSNRYGSRYANQRSAHWNDPYDLDELTGHEDGSSSPNTAAHSASATYYRNGSEEKILPEQMPPITHTKGIVMTTEINVQ